MPRSGDEARRRLQRAALDLYGERGFDATTAAEIAASAGVTERTFFRHFADKREVLFEGESALCEALVSAVRGVSDGAPPLAILRRAFRTAAAPVLEADRRASEARHRVISASAALRERELAKGGALRSALVEALVARGLDRRVARLATEISWVAWAQAIDDWLGDPASSLTAELERQFDDLVAIASSG
jgi:AcrR family transcriptional regulator